MEMRSLPLSFWLGLPVWPLTRTRPDSMSSCTRERESSGQFAATKRSRREPKSAGPTATSRGAREEDTLDWGMQRETEYDEKRYHQPSDEFDPTWDFSGLAELSRFGIELGWKVADMGSTAQWVAGDEFEAARKQSQAK